MGWIVRFSVLGVAWLISLAATAEEATPLGIPLKPDPPFAVEGDLGDWTSVPNAIALDETQQVVWGKTAWSSIEDLSGTVRVAWRNEHLYVAADVVDDTVSQRQRGQGLWKGDHVEVYLDVRPDWEPGRKTFGEGQYHFGFSPGNFGATGDPLVDCPPETFCYRPEGGSVEGVAVASARTASGWTIEAAIPWTLLGVASPATGTPLHMEIALSDTDSPEPQQESLMTTSTATWAHDRGRLRPAVLAGTDGIPPAVSAGIPVFDNVALERDKEATFSFEAPAPPTGQEAILTLLARLDSDRVAGHTPALMLRLNGTALDGDRLRNKPMRVKARGGDVYSMAAGECLTTYYSPGFVAPDSDPHYGLVGGVRPCLFELVVTDLVKPGANALVVANRESPNVDNVLYAAEARLVFRVPPPAAREKAGPPTGPLPRFEPDSKHAAEFVFAESPDARIEIEVQGEKFRIESRFSTPAPGWVHGSNAYFRLERKIERASEALVVRDTFVNLTGENLPLMHRHECALGDRLGKLWLGGLEQTRGSGSTSDSGNCTTYATSAECGLGFISLDDVFRVHVTNYAVSDAIGIADNSLVLPPNGTYTSEWAILPTETADYWAFINAARRLADANFTIDGAFAFLRAAPETDKWSDQQIADFLRFKDARYACASIVYPRYKGRYTHGTSFQMVTHDNYRAAFERWHRLVPEIKTLVYFHCFIDVTDEGPERYADARHLRPDGIQADYGEPYDRIYFPTESNGYGPSVAKNIDVILDEIGADGVYWDEHEYSRYAYHYGEPWDGCSGDIDPAKMTIARLKSSVTLLTESWRLALARRILARGPLIGNGVPRTRAMAALKFPCFVETGSITNCVHSHLYSPIALGDHLTERSETDAYRTMLDALDYGCVYHWYNDLNVMPTHHHLTAYMYPITPLELHEGYIVGEERIVTKRSGLFGWGDLSGHEVHVFDDTGCEAAGFAAPEVVENGKRYTELRLAEGWSAAIVRAATR